MVFLGLLSVGLLCNIFYDIRSVLNLRSARATRDLVTHTHDVLFNLHKLDHAIEILALQPKAERRFGEVLAQTDFVQNLVRSPIQKELIREVSVQAVKSPAQASITMDKMISIESQFLSERLAREFGQNGSIEESLLSALMVNGLLLLVMLALYLSDLRTAKQIEENLSKSMRDLMVANSTLYQELTKRQVLLRATVHDLKNPLGSIHGFAELISDNGNIISIHDCSERIKRISQTSLDLVETLLNQSPGQENAPRRPIFLESIVNDVCDQMEVLAKEKSQAILRKITIKDKKISGNYMRLIELVTNLLGNAIKYSPEHSTITVRGQAKGERLRIEIEDQGPGFSAEDRAKAFQYGQTLSAKPTQNESSSGYGLFVAKLIVQAHNGEVGICDPSAGKGGCVYFEIPVLQAEAGARDDQMVPSFHVPSAFAHSESRDHRRPTP